MAEVTFPVEFGGSGITITDDADPNTGLGNSGHRVRFIPALKGTVDMAAFTKSQADITNAARVAAQQARTEAVSASLTATTASETAVVSAEAAESAAQNAASIYPTVEDGLSNTVNGEYFKVPSFHWVQVYRKMDDVASPIVRLASEDTLERLNTRLDPMLTSLLFN